MRPVDIHGYVNLCMLVESSRPSEVLACSASLGRSNWPLEPARRRWGARNALGRSKSLLRPARRRWSAQIGRSASLGCRNGRSSLLGFAGAGEIAAQAGLAGALDIAAQAHSDEETCEKIFEHDVLWSRLALNTWLCSSLHCARICTGPR